MCVMVCFSIKNFPKSELLFHSFGTKTKTCIRENFTGKIGCITIQKLINDG